VARSLRSSSLPEKNLVSEINALEGDSSAKELTPIQKVAIKFLWPIALIVGVFALLIIGAWFLHLPSTPPITATAAQIGTYKSLVDEDQAMVEGIAKTCSEIITPIIALLGGYAFGKAKESSGD
jgi:Na+/H+ antiporter NhaC